jgi:hypothetical protein
MVTRLAIVLILLSWLPLTTLAADLRLEVDSDTVELGLPVTARLYGIGIKQPLGNIDLQPLAQDFGVKIPEDVSIVSDPRWPGQRVQYQQLLLYPRSTGTLEIPSLVLGDLDTYSQPVHVVPGSTRKGTINVDMHLSADTVWQRQQLIYSVKVTTPDRFASLHIEQADVPGFEVVVIPASRHYLDSGEAVLRGGWLLYPLIAGQQQPQLPPVKYRISGVYQRYYYAPVPPIKVKRLPAYIPPTLPVGRVAISSRIQPEYLLQTGNLSYLHIELQGHAMPPLWLPAILRQIRSSDSLQVLPADSQRDARPDPQGMHSHVIHTIPFKALTNGPLSLPQLRMQYFDPATARLVTVKHTLPTTLAVSLGWRIIILAILLALLVYITRRVVRLLYNRRQYRRQRRQVLHAMARANSPTELRSALRDFAAVEGWPQNLALSGWLRHWQRGTNDNNNIDELVAQLSAASYAGHASEDIQQLRMQFYQNLC